LRFEWTLPGRAASSGCSDGSSRRRRCKQPYAATAVVWSPHAWKATLVKGHVASVGGEADASPPYPRLSEGDTLPSPSLSGVAPFPFLKESSTRSMESHGLSKAMPPPSGRSRWGHPSVSDKKRSPPVQGLPMAGVRFMLSRPASSPGGGPPSLWDAVEVSLVRGSFSRRLTPPSTFFRPPRKVT